MIEHQIPKSTDPLCAKGEKLYELKRDVLFMLGFVVRIVCLIACSLYIYIVHCILYTFKSDMLFLA